jgi:hypothetical protein
MKNLLLILFLAGSIIACSEKTPNNFLVGSCVAYSGQPVEWSCDLKKFLEIRDQKKDPYMGGGFYYYKDNTTIGIFYGLHLINVPLNQMNDVQRLMAEPPLKIINSIKYEILKNGKKIKSFQNIRGCIYEDLWEKEDKKFFKTTLYYEGNCDTLQREAGHRMIQAGKKEVFVFFDRNPPLN